MWGGGVYQPSSTSVGTTLAYPPHVTDTYSFYATCDALGILAWSEFIFSDALYALDDWLLDSVDVEVRQNVRRVNRHASNVQWAGGNEIEGIVQGVNVSGVADAKHYLDEVSGNCVRVGWFINGEIRPWAVCHAVPGYSTRYGVRRDQFGEFRGPRNAHRRLCTQFSDVD